MARSEQGLQALHLSQALYGLMAPAARTLADAPREGPRRGDSVWAFGAFLEAGGWLCLGSDLGYFPREGTTEVLRPLLDMEAARALSEEERRPVVGNAWAEHLAAGDVDQALEVRPFRDTPAEAGALQPAFQTAWSFAARLAASATLNRFLKALLVLEDDAWYRDVLDDQVLRKVSTGDLAVWRQLAPGHPLDGLIATLYQLQILSTWAFSTAEVDSRGESPGVASRERGGPGIPESTAGRLVRSAGQLLRWRLDLSNERVQQRLGTAIELADRRLPELMAALGHDIRDAWPEGFRTAMDQALADWDEISGETMRGRPSAPPSIAGSGAEAVRPEERAGTAASKEAEIYA